MFHVELRRFPHSTHAFNLTEEEVQALILSPWRQGRTAELGERRWVAEATRVVILRGPRLAPEELGLGRGWSAARRTGQDVTREMMAPDAAPTADQSSATLEQALAARACDGPLNPWEAWLISAAQQPQGRPGQTLAAAERALLAMLADGRLAPCDADGLPSAGRGPAPDQAPALFGHPDAWLPGQGPQLCAGRGDAGTHDPGPAAAS